MYLSDDSIDNIYAKPIQPSVTSSISFVHVHVKIPCYLHISVHGMDIINYVNPNATQSRICKSVVYITFHQATSFRMFVIATLVGCIVGSFKINYKYTTTAVNLQQ